MTRIAAAAVALVAVAGVGGCGGGSSSSHGSGGSFSSGGASGNVDPPAAQTIPTEVRGSGIVSFQMITGQANWQVSAENVAANSVLELGSGGSCKYDTVDTVGTPMPCTYSVDGDQISFSGSDTTPGAAGSFSLQVSGSVNLSDHTMQIDYVGGSGMAAVVDGQSFSGASSIHWSAVVRAS